jgi:hypothetical protein
VDESEANDDVNMTTATVAVRERSAPAQPHLHGVEPSTIAQMAENSSRMPVAKTIGSVTSQPPEPPGTIQGAHGRIEDVDGDIDMIARDFENTPVRDPAQE